MPITLIPPSQAYAEQVMAYRAEMLASGDSLDGCAGLEDVQSFDESVDVDRRLKCKHGEGYVPSRVYLAVRLEDNRVVGIMDYRHPLSPFLLRYGGNSNKAIFISAQSPQARMSPGLLTTCRRVRAVFCVHSDGKQANSVKEEQRLPKKGILPPHATLQ